MMYKAKAAVCSEIRIKHSTQSEYHVEFLNVNHLKPKRTPLYLKTQSVPRCKHFISVIKTNQFML